MDKASDFFSDISKEFANQYLLNGDFKDRYKLWIYLIDKYSKGKKNAIDMGCGTGIFSFYIANKGIKVTGIDAAKNMIETALETLRERNNKNIDFKLVEIPDGLEKIKFEKVDMIISSSLLEYIDELSLTLDLFRNLLNKDGCLILSFPNRQSIYRIIEKFFYLLIKKPRYYKYVRNVLSLKCLESMLKKIGLSMVEFHYYGHE